MTYMEPIGEDFGSQILERQGTPSLPAIPVDLVVIWLGNDIQGKWAVRLVSLAELMPLWIWSGLNTLHTLTKTT